MKCLNCNNEAKGRSKYCGDGCKVAYNRNKNRNTVTPETVTSVTVTETVTPDTGPANWPGILTDLPPGVCKPTGIPTKATADKTAPQLQAAMRIYRGTDWTASSSYAETVYRLLTWTVDELEAVGHMIPVWKQNGVTV